MRVTLIHNPQAGAQGKEDAELLQRVLREAGCKVRYESSKDDDWDETLQKPADVIAVAGGDGTVSKVARRIVGRGIPLAPLPCGTANNIARTLGMAGIPLEVLVDGWRNPRIVKLDLGRLRAPWGERGFLEGVGAGLFATLLASKPKNGTKPASADARVVSGLERLKKLAREAEAMEIRAKLDGENISGRYLLVEAMNIPYIGPSLYLAPESTPGDGTLDVVLVGEAERERLCKYLDSWQDNRERIAVLPSRRGSHLQIEWDGFPIHVDDKLRPRPKKDEAEPPGRIDVRLDGLKADFLCPPGGG
ncbi:MAG: diacylglycerol/lipid kinase family protein [Betaproteobacteria bacterium]